MEYFISALSEVLGYIFALVFLVLLIYSVKKLDKQERIKNAWQRFPKRYPKFKENASIIYATLIALIVVLGFVIARFRLHRLFID